MDFRKTREETRRMFLDNKESIYEYNARFVKKAIMVGIIVMACVLSVALLTDILKNAIPGYVATLVMYLAYLVIFLKTKLSKHSLLATYLVFCIFYFLALYISVFSFPDRVGGTILMYFCIAPIFFIDKKHNLLIYIALQYAVFITLVFIFKERTVAIVDTVNTTVSVILGVSLGDVVLRERLENLETKRLLKIEKGIDILTGLYNRAKLMDDLTTTYQTNKPTAMFMIDIDFFKEFNDTFGHAVGDECLRQFGELLLEIQKTNKISIYRYGGEEFLGLAYCDDDDVRSLAEEIRVRSSLLVINERRIYVSVGVGYTEGEKDYNKVIQNADDALYIAKQSGRNRVFVKENIDVPTLF